MSESVSASAAASAGATPHAMSLDEFRLLADRAGLGLSDAELAELKPVYELHAAYARQLHTLNLGATEMVTEFHPDWPEG